MSRPAGGGKAPATSTAASPAGVTAKVLDATGRELGVLTFADAGADVDARAGLWVG